jgi:hypothetical protein
MKWKTGFLFVALASLTFVMPSALANTKLSLFTATSDAFNGQLEISLSVDENAKASSLIYTDAKGDTEIPLASLPEGAVIYQASGKNVITLLSSAFTAENGGPLDLKYLYSGVSNSYSTFHFAIGRDGQNWTPYVTNTHGIPQAFTSMYLKAKRVLGSVVGIASITVQ